MSPKDGVLWKAQQNLLSFMKRCWSIKHLKEIHARIIHTGFHHNLLLVGKIIEFCAVSEHADMDYALSVFDNIHKPDAFIWNTMIRGFGKTKQPEKAIHYYKKMQRNAYVAPDTFTFSFVLKITGGLGSVTLGKQLHCSILKLGFQTHTYVRNSLMHMYGIVTDIKTAHQLFEEIPNPDLVAWNSIIDCHVYCRNYKGALGIFIRMLQTGMQPDDASLVVTLSACGAIGALDFGRWIHSLIQEDTKLCDITSVSNSLVDMYCKCGAVEEASEIFNNMKGKNIISWNVMILGLASHGNGEEALSLFTKMLQENVERPNDVTFLGVLSACSRGGLVDECRRYIDVMGKDYHIQPTIKHYGCMVDLLGRAGLVEDAYNLIKNMPVECNTVVWRTLLAACRLHGCVELGEKVRKHLLELEPDNSSDYVLLANMYATTGQWNEMSKERRSMRERRVQKPEPGNSFIGIPGLRLEKETIER
ncbi:pentatricopeptide repeat-containing protein At1g59720, chloroplastic/mitochondrial-like [Abrus precatorius]|uniref:Pentatricopeptide repeat-containing protein At1g59720, chloroplastic/mitochondrial-like n=1 Tax=Abrus precatorius TaxID=3816 RepID=A0A8B8K729_ABRPR|nr:pentatricopeptide repeat-containing protein At1g59720, chloroplastic/mitochondrial-like [Abrus precatorius]